MCLWAQRAAAQMKLDVFNKETTVAENKEAIRLLREADIFRGSAIHRGFGQ